jgi:type II secretory pathway predicted ATPase ExeA/cell division septation protein DedD
MYCQFYGFSEKPFDVTPDSNFLYLGAQYRELLASLIYGIRERRGLVALVGEVGMGKTTLLNAVQDRLDQKTKVAFISNTNLTFEQLLNMVILELGIAESAGEFSKVDALNRLNDFAMKQLAQGGGAVIIVDEAQNLDARSLENLRLLSNLETRKHKLIQIILAGQPELDVKLNRPELRQLFQRISLKRYITPLSKKETDDYIQDRLVLADYRGRSLFSRKAQEIIWKYSEGVPRKINILCDNALLIGYAQGKKTIDKAVMAEAVKDLSWSPFSRTGDSFTPPADGEEPRRVKSIGFWPWPALTVGLVVVVSLVMWVIFFRGGISANHQGAKDIAFHKADQETIMERAPGSGPRDATIHAQAATAVYSGAMDVPGDKTGTAPSSQDEQIEASPKAPEPSEGNSPSSPEKATEGPSAGKLSPLVSHVTASKTLSPQPGDLVIQVGAFREIAIAENEVKGLLSRGYNAFVEKKAFKNGEDFYRVRLHGYKDFAEAAAAMAMLREEGYKDCFLARQK